MGSTARGAAALLLALTLMAGCGGDSSDDGSGGTSATSSKGPVTLSFWAWAPNISKVVKRWNDTHPDIQVKVSQPAQGDDLVTKLITANKAGNPPDLAQAEYQALPSLLLTDAVADITKRVEPVKGKFSDGDVEPRHARRRRSTRSRRTSAPMMLLLPQGPLRAASASTCPRPGTSSARPPPSCAPKDSKRYLTTFSANDPGWFAGLAQQAGAEWWTIDGETWRSASTTTRPRRSPTTGAAWSPTRRPRRADVHAAVEQDAQRRHAAGLAERRLGPGRARGRSRRRPRASGRWRRCRSGARATTARLLGRLVDRGHGEVQAPGRGGGVRQAG